ncbi:hypothetical protein [Phaeovulum vinaykumarii]|uniref:hypothetical protein n=1 Tax=Phaeovulum vinaykumarii TaxID=407234 RepID=UPI00117A1E4B|nr:hypothetical protein [Phaeovulum vinaykumarii]
MIEKWISKRCAGGQMSIFPPVILSKKDRIGGVDGAHANTFKDRVGVTVVLERSIAVKVEQLQRRDIRES